MRNLLVSAVQCRLEEGRNLHNLETGNGFLIVFPEASLTLIRIEGVSPSLQRCRSPHFFTSSIQEVALYSWRTLRTFVRFRRSEPM